MNLPEAHCRIVDYLRRYNVEIAGRTGISRGAVFLLAKWLEENPPTDAVFEFTPVPVEE